MSRADLVAGIALLGACSLWSGLTWGRLYDPIVDQGWQMQAAARVADGQVLYRDLIWMYGPLPVYLLALLFRWLGIGVTPFLLLIHALALLCCGVLARNAAHGWLTAAGWAFVVGIFLFSGSLYLLSLGGPRFLGPVTPLGGLAFIVGWTALAVSAVSRRT